MDPDSTEAEPKPSTATAWHRSFRQRLASELHASTQRHILGCLKKAEAAWHEVFQLLLQSHPTSNVDEKMEALRAKAAKDLSAHNCSKKIKHQYQTFFGFTSKEMRTVCEVFNPERFQPRLERFQFRLDKGMCFDIDLGWDLLKRSSQSTVISYIKHHRPGLTIVSPPCEAFSQLQSLSLNFRLNDWAAMKRHLEKLKKARRLLRFGMRVCALCRSLGLSYLFPAVVTVMKFPDTLVARGDQCLMG